MSGEKTKKLYEELSSEYELPTIEEFASSLNDSTKLKEAYDFISSKYDAGTIDDFRESLGQSLGGQLLSSALNPPMIFKPDVVSRSREEADKSDLPVSGFDVPELRETRTRPGGQDVQNLGVPSVDEQGSEVFMRTLTGEAIFPLEEVTVETESPLMRRNAEVRKLNAKQAAFVEASKRLDERRKNLRTNEDAKKYNDDVRRHNAALKKLKAGGDNLEKEFKATQTPEVEALRKRVESERSQAWQREVIASQPESLSSPERQPYNIPATNVGVSDIPEATLRGGAEGLTVEVPRMVGQAAEYFGFKDAGKAIQDWSDGVAESMFGAEPEYEGLAKIAYEGSKMMAPSIVPAGAAGLAAKLGLAGVKSLSVAQKAKIVQRLAAGASATLFGASTAGDVEKRAAQKQMEAGFAPEIEGAIEALGEYVGTRYMGKMLGLDENELRVTLANFIKTLGVENSTEMMQQLGQSITDKVSGIRPDANPLEEMISVIGPTTFMTVMTGGLGKAGEIAFNRGKEEISQKPTQKASQSSVSAPQSVERETGDENVAQEMKTAQKSNLSEQQEPQAGLTSSKPSPEISDLNNRETQASATKQGEKEAALSPSIPAMNPNDTRNFEDVAGEFNDAWEAQEARLEPFESRIEEIRKEIKELPKKDKSIRALRDEELAVKKQIEDVNGDINDMRLEVFERESEMIITEAEKRGIEFADEGEKEQFVQQAMEMMDVTNQGVREQYWNKKFSDTFNDVITQWKEQTNASAVQSTQEEVPQRGTEREQGAVEGGSDLRQQGEEQAGEKPKSERPAEEVVPIITEKAAGSLKSSLDEFDKLKGEAKLDYALSTSETVGGVRHELLYNDDASRNDGLIRTVDEKTGAVLSEKQYGAFKQAKGVFHETLSGLREAEEARTIEEKKPIEKGKAERGDVSGEQPADVGAVAKGEKTSYPPLVGERRAEVLKRYGGIPDKSLVAYESAMGKAVNEGNPADLMGVLHTGNKNLRRMFTDDTGVKLPNTEGGTRAAIRGWSDKIKGEKNVPKVEEKVVPLPAQIQPRSPVVSGAEEAGQAGEVREWIPKAGDVVQSAFPVEGVDRPMIVKGKIFSGRGGKLQVKLETGGAVYDFRPNDEATPKAGTWGLVGKRGVPSSVPTERVASKDAETVGLPIGRAGEKVEYNDLNRGKRGLNSYEKGLAERRAAYAEQAKETSTQKLTETLEQIGDTTSDPSDGLDRMRKEAIKAELSRRSQPIPTLKEKATTVSSEIDDLWKDFNKSLGQLQSGLSPEQLTIGTKLVAKYTEMGVYKFADIANDAYKRFGEKAKELLAALKAAYASFAATAPDDIADQLSDMKEIRAFQLGTKTTEPSLQKAEEEDVTKLAKPSGETLEGIPAAEVRGSRGEQEAQRGVGIRSEADRTGSIRTDVRGSQLSGGVGTDAGEVFVPARGEEGRTTPDDPGLQVVGSPQQNYRITDKDRLGQGGITTKFNDNLAAIRLLKQLQQEGRQATSGEKSVLVRYIGWGGMKSVFPDAKGKHAKGWEARHAELKKLLTDEGYKAARRSVLDSHYTSEAVVRAMWKIAERFGFKNGAVLEPTVGTGNFIGLKPSNVDARVTAAELDPTTVGIAKQLYPESNIVGPTGFQDVPLADDYFALSIGNPPFGEQTLPYGESKHLKGFSIHNAIIAREIDKTAPGGIVMNVITKSFLDKSGEKQRGYAAHRTKFIGAIRLPNSAFQENANTEVTTDIVILQKLPKEEWGKSDQSWTRTTEIPDPLGGEAIPINTYFADNPEMMLGRMERAGKMYRQGEATLTPFEDKSIAELLDGAIEKLPKDIMPQFSTVQPTEKMVEQSVEMAGSFDIGQYFVDGEKVYQRIPSPDGTAMATEITVNTPSEKQTWGISRVKRLEGMIRIREAARQQLKLEMQDAPKKEMEKSRKHLNSLYDRFVEKHGFLNSRTNQQIFADDPDAPLLSALEDEYEAGVSEQRAKTLKVPSREPSAKKAAIFSNRVVAPYVPATKADNVQDALFITLSEKGGVDVAHMAKLTGKNAEEITNELSEAGLIFKNPKTDKHEIASEYLSGNVKQKAREAEEAGLEKNAEALRSVFPKDIPAGDIRARLGVAWIPGHDYEEFIKSLLGEGTTATVRYLPAAGGFHVRIEPGSQTKNTNEFGTARMGAHKIIALTMNNKDVVIWSTDPTTKQRFVDKYATEEAKQKQAIIRQEFDDWLFKDSDRRQRLTQFYNDNINVNVEPKYDGSHLALPGKVPNALVKLRNHQQNAIWRVVLKKKALLDHVVGSGKTFSVVGAAMEMKRLGLARKPMVVVPNHLVEQWSADFLRLYPGAKILTMRKKDFEAKNRKTMLARIATGNWDAVVIAHSSFGFIKTGREEQIRFIEEQIQAMQESIDIVREEEGKDPRKVKDMERSQEKMRASISELTDMAKDDMLSFEELGVDQLFVDESHEFKNLFFSASRRMLGLGDPKGSKKAMDMFIKTRWLQEQGKGVVFATGTPISNSLSEMYTLQRYLGMDELRRTNIMSFDAWVNMYGDESSDYELDGTGVKYKSTARLRALVNLPELMAQYRQFSDSVTMDDVKRVYREVEGKEFPIPRVKGGKPENVVVPRSQAQADYFEKIVERAKNLKRGDRDNMLAITMDARKAALDMRLVDGNHIDDQKGKVDEAADRITEMWKRSQKQRGAQLVFLDLSVPLSAAKKQYTDIQKLIQLAEAGDESAQERLEKLGPDDLAAAQSALRGFSVYDDLKAKIIRRGVNEKEIVFIHDYNTDEKKADLFEQVNAGRIRVLFGSTSKMGSGMNVQKRAVALHHLDCPWRPSDIEQREGRIVRQGNLLYEQDPENFSVEIHRYSTEQTYDARMWQVQEQKLRGIEGIRGFSGQREMEEVAAAAASAAEMKAAASGNPLILEDVQIAEAVRRLEAAQKRHTKNQYELEDKLKDYERKIKNLPTLIAGIEEDVAAARSWKENPYGNNPPTGTVDGKTITSAKEALEAGFESIRKQKAEQGVVETNQVKDDLFEGEPTDKKRAKYSVEVNGTPITSESALLAAVHERWGDRTPFAMTIDGKQHIALREAAAATMERARDFGRKLSSNPKELTIGKIGEFDVTLTPSQWAGNMTVNLLRGDRRYDSAPVFYDADKSPEIGLRVVNKAVSLISASVESNLQYAKNSLATANREIGDVRGNIGKKWGKEEELGAKRTRHAEVRRLLSGKESPQILPNIAPAVQVGENLYKGSPNEIHADNLARMTPEDQFRYLDGEGVDGFVDELGKFMTRIEAAKRPVLEVDDAIKSITDRLHPDVVKDIIVAPSWQAPKEIRPTIAKSKRTTAAYYDGKVYIFTDRNATPEERQKVLIHELVHYAVDKNPSNVLQSVFGKNADEFLQKLWNDRRADIEKQEWFERYTQSKLATFDPKTEDGQKNLANEYIAHIARDPRSNTTAYRKFLDWVRAQLRKLFPSLRYTDVELQRFVGNAFRAMGKPVGERTYKKAEPMFMYGGESATGFELAKKFTGKFDKKKRFELDDSQAKVGGDRYANLGRVDGSPLADVLEHVELFKNYPHLADVQVVAFPSTNDFGENEGTRAFFSSEKNTIGVAQGLSDEQAKSAILHEVQHAIQFVEGFARGGSMNAKEVHLKADDAINTRRDYLNKKMASLKNFQNSIVKPEKKTFAEQREAYDRFFETNPEWTKRHDEVWNELRLLNGGGFGRAKYLLDAYRSLAGEVESRDVQARMNLSAEERSATKPYSSEAYKLKDVIVEFDSEPNAYQFEQRPKPMFRAAAIKLPTGEIYEGRTHPAALEQYLADVGETVDIFNEEFDKRLGAVNTGFITGDGRFVDRKEAVKMMSEFVPGVSENRRALVPESNLRRHRGALAHEAKEETDEQILERLKPIIESTGGYNVRVDSSLGKPIVYFEHRDIKVGGEEVPTTFARFPKDVDTVEKVRDVVNEKLAQFGQKVLPNLKTNITTENQTPQAEGRKKLFSTVKKRLREQKLNYFGWRGQRNRIFKELLPTLIKQNSEFLQSIENLPDEALRQIGKGISKAILAQKDFSATYERTAYGETKNETITYEPDTGTLIGGLAFASDYQPIEMLRLLEKTYETARRTIFEDFERQEYEHYATLSNKVEAWELTKDEANTSIGYANALTATGWREFRDNAEEHPAEWLVRRFQGEDEIKRFANREEAENYIGDDGEVFPIAPERTFYRKGKPPESGRSFNHAENKSENGVSVYVTPQAGSLAGEGSRDTYYGKGRQIDSGGDDEPVIVLSGEWKKYPGHKNIIRQALDDGKPVPLEVLKDYPDLNKPSRAPEVGAQSPAFKKWFGNSKVVDENGKPLVVYHASLKGVKFNVFDTSKEGSHFGSQEQATNLSGFERGKPRAFFLSIQNPLRMSDTGVWSDFNNLHAALAREDVITPKEADAIWDSWQQGDTKGYDAIKKTLATKGYDGIVYENEQEGNGDSYVAFSPTQIKSATGNRGTFDAKNPNILMNLSPEQEEKKPLARRLKPSEVTKIGGKYAYNINIDKLDISDDAKKELHRTVKDVRSRLEEIRGKTLTDAEVLEAAEASDIITRAIGREHTLKVTAAVTKLRQAVAAGAEGQGLTKEFLSNLKVVSSYAAEAGRTLQKFNLEVGPRLDTLKNQIAKDLLNKGFEIDDILAQAEGVDWNDPRSVAEFYRHFVKPEFRELLDEFRYINMLSSPLTHSVNAFSNMIQVLGLAPATHLVGGGIDFVARGLSGASERQMYAKEVAPYYRGVFNAIPEAGRKFSLAMQGKVFVQRPDVDYLPTVGEAKHPILKPLAKFNDTFRFVLNALEASDIFFRTLVKAGEKEALSTRMVENGQAINVELIEEEAERKSQYYVFRSEIDPKNETGQGDLLAWIDKLTMLAYSVRSVPVLGLAVPFIRTPMNILKQGVEYSPFGFATIVGNKQKTEQFAKALIGSIVFLMAALVAAAGDSTWAVPRGKKRKEEFYATGKQPYSLKIGDTWVSYSKLGPLAYPIALAAALRYYTEQDPEAINRDTVTKIAQATFGGVEFFSDQSYVKGLEALFSERPLIGKVEDFVGNTSRQFVPLSSLQGWVARIIDPVYRNPEGLVEKIQTGIPFASKGVKAYESRGKESKRPLPFVNALLPAAVRQDTTRTQAYPLTASKERKSAIQMLRRELMK